MSDAGKAIIMACSALLFIFAMTTSIYLYTTLNTYIDDSTSLTNVYDRAEGQVSLPIGTDREDQTKKRKIDCSEINITVTNMAQMYVNKVIVKVNGQTFEFNKDDDNLNKLRNLNNVSNITNENFKYQYDTATSTVTYTAQ